MERGEEVLQDLLSKKVEWLRVEVNEFKEAASEQIRDLILAEAAELEDIFPKMDFKGNEGLPTSSKGVVLALHVGHDHRNEAVLTPKGIFICTTYKNPNMESHPFFNRSLPSIRDIEEPSWSYLEDGKWLDYGEKAAKALEFMRLGRFTTDKYGMLVFEGL